MGGNDDSDRLAAAVSRARAQWPSLPADGFEAHVRAKAQQKPVQELALGDLFLAHACAAHHEDALSSFEESCIAPLERALSHLRLSADRLDEVKQRVRTHLLISEHGRPPRILEYGGRGDLASWVAVVALRQALSMLRAKQPSGQDMTGRDDVLMGLESPRTGPELAFLKSQYQDLFVQAFADSLFELGPRARNALRQHYVHGLTIDEIAAIYGIHRSNAARRIAKARDTLLAATRRRMVLGLRVDREEFEAIMRLIESKLDLSLQVLLADPDSGQ